MSDKEKGLREEFHKIAKDVLKYYELRWELFKLELVESLAQLYTKVFSIFLLWIIVPIFMLFILVALALYLGKLWGAYYLGFLAVGGVVLLIFILILLFKKALITNPLVDALVSAFFEEDTENEIKKSKYESKNTKN